MGHGQPHITVVIPTLRRPEALARAVASLTSQDYANWDAVISDDSDEGTAEGARDRVGDDRITVIRNQGEPGQARNLANAIRHSKGNWVKPLFDDDALHPRCLSTIAAAVERSRGAGMIRGLARDVFAGAPGRRSKTNSPRPGARSRLERMRGDDALKALLVHDEDIGIPSQVAVRGDLARNVLPEDVPGLVSGIDIWWYARLLKQADLLLLNEVLVDRHQGEHETVTSSLTTTELDREFELLNRLIRPLVDGPLNETLEEIDGGTRAIRAVHRLGAGHPAEALRLARAGTPPRSWAIATRWVLRRAVPGRFERFPRQAVPFPAN